MQETNSLCKEKQKNFTQEIHPYKEKLFLSYFHYIKYNKHYLTRRRKIVKLPISNLALREGGEFSHFLLF